MSHIMYDLIDEVFTFTAAVVVVLPAMTTDLSRLGLHTAITGGVNVSVINLQGILKRRVTVIIDYSIF